ncbi:MAG: twin-arginine translocase TatA/TatE family subunit [Verrucomicrobia bacterium]|nr:twin-arginine translocase TatA/TatE family subunit [Verrucomicrobiota bacterium]
MNTIVYAMLGWPEIVGILIIVLVLFGAKKVPELMRGLGSGLKEFKKATREVQDELQQAIEDEPTPSHRTKPEPASSTAHSESPDDHADESSPPADPAAGGEHWSQRPS